MEFVKVGKNYMIKGSNGRIVSEEEKIQLENNELVLKDLEGCNCQQETTKKISKNKKRMKELEKRIIKNEIVKNLKINNVEVSKNEETNKITALEEGESADDTIEETVKSI